MIKTLTFALAMTLSLTGCTTATTAPKVNYSYGIATTGDFSFLPNQAVSTYAWKKGPVVARVSSELDGDRYLAVIRSLIDNEMAQKGYIKIDASQSPSMLMDFGIATESKMNDQEIFKSTQISTGIQVAAAPGEKGEKGTIYVAAFAPNSDFPRWRVLAQGPTEQRVDDPQEHEEMQRIISLMLNTVPVKQ